MDEHHADPPAPRSRRAPWCSLLASAGLSLLGAACGGEPDAAPGEPVGKVADRATAAGPAMSGGTVPGDLVAVARADLAKRLGVAEDAVEVVSVREVTWPDGSVGCPQPGMAYTQALVNGSQIVLRHGGTDYHYHAGGARGPFYCADPKPPVPEGAGGGDR